MNITNLIKGKIEKGKFVKSLKNMIYKIAIIPILVVIILFGFTDKALSIMTGNLPSNCTWPVDSPIGTSDYAIYNDVGNYMYHTGIDMVSSLYTPSNYNTPVKAVAAGTVYKIFRTSDTTTTCQGNTINATIMTHGEGNVVIIQHSNGRFTQYDHLDCINDGIVPNASVSAGQVIGIMGNSTNVKRDSSVGVHVHLEYKDYGVVGSISDDYDGSHPTYWGYTPDLPDGYYFHDPRFIACPSVSSTNITPAPIIINTTNVLNVRSGPSTDFAILTQVNINQKFVAFQTSNYSGNTWYRIYLPNVGGPQVNQALTPDMAAGWVSGAYVSQDNSDSMIEVYNTSSPPPPGLNVRDAAGGNLLQRWDNTYSVCRNVKVWDSEYFVLLSSQSGWDNYNIPQNHYGSTCQTNPTGPDNGWSSATYLNVIPNTSCSYSISPNGQSYGSSGGSGTISVTTGSGCFWNAVSSDTSWLTITSGSSGSGNGTVYYSVSANTSTSSRTGTITVGGQIFTVNQAGATSCSYSISPTNQSFSSSGGSGTISVTTGSGCFWNAVSSDTSWLTITSGSSGSGNGTVYYSVSVNTSTSSRTGTIIIQGQTFTVNQDGTTTTSPHISVSPASYDFGSVTIGSSISQTVSVFNTGNANLSINSIYIANTSEFSQINNCSTVAPNSFCSIYVTFTPASSGTKTANLTINSNDPNGQVNVSLTGMGTSQPIPHISVSPMSYNFGSIYISESSSPISITISNTGVAALNITNMTLSDTADYSLNITGGTSTCGGTSPILNPNSSCSVAIIFNPKAAGTKDGIFTIVSNDPNGTVNVQLTGTGVSNLTTTTSNSSAGCACNTAKSNSGSYREQNSDVWLSIFISLLPIIFLLFYKRKNTVLNKGGYK